MNSEMSLRLGFFFGVFAVMALAETVRPYRNPAGYRGHRWITNLAITFGNSLLIKILFPVSAVMFAQKCNEWGIGAFNLLALPSLAATVMSVIVLDMVIYTQHLVFHRVPVLWRLHRMHHSDTGFDVTTGARFHPLEIVLSMLIKLSAIALFGATPTGVFAFEVLLNATAMFNHSNVALPTAIDRFVRLFVVTPSMHRVHHSVRPDEMNSNFGFNLPVWDRLFGTYRESAAENDQLMAIGLTKYRNPDEQGLKSLLAQPFKK